MKAQPKKLLLTAAFLAAIATVAGGDVGVPARGPTAPPPATGRDERLPAGRGASPTSGLPAGREASRSPIRTGA